MLWKQHAPSVTLGGAPVTGGRHPSFLSVAAAAVLAVVFATPLTRAQRADAGYWIDTWTASQPIWDAEFPVPLNIPRALRNQTVRQIAAVSIGGNRVRGAVKRIWVKAAGDRCGAYRPGWFWRRERGRLGPTLSFGGHSSVTIPPGAPVISDPVDLTVAPLSNVTISLFLPEQTPLTTVHWEGVQTAYISPEGNFAGDADMKVDQR